MKAKKGTLSFKKIINFLLMTLTCAQISPQNLEQIRVAAIAVFQEGSGYGQLGHDRYEDVGATDPNAIAFDKNNNLYVLDNSNKRIVVFNSKFEFVRNIDDVDYISAYLSIEGDGSIIVESIHSYLEADAEGKLEVVLYQKGPRELPRILKEGDIYFYYSPDGSLEGYINPGVDSEVNSRNLKKGDEIKTALTRLGLSLSRVGESSGSVTSQGGALQVPQRSSVQGNKVFKDGKVVSKDLKDFLAFSDASGLGMSKSVAGTVKKYNKEVSDYLQWWFYGPRATPRLLSVDASGKSYWRLSESDGVAILDSDRSTLLKVFRIPYTADGYHQLTFPAVTLSGDMYYLAAKGDAYYLMKLARDW